LEFAQLLDRYATFSSQITVPIPSAASDIFAQSQTRPFLAVNPVPVSVFCGHELNTAGKRRTGLRDYKAQLRDAMEMRQ